MFDLAKPAAFPGGPLEMNRYFKEKLQYPKAHGHPKGNRLIIAFVVERDGTVGNTAIHIFETPGAAFTGAVLSCLQNSKWIPAEANGHPVRNLMLFMFFFHHQAALVSWRETHIDLFSYEQLLAIKPQDYSKIGFFNKPQFMGIDPHDSIEYRQRYPEAAQLANVQGEVEVDVLIQKNGQVGDITLTHDIGYGCGEEALRRARLYRNWVPAQLFDSVFDAHIPLTFSFCPNRETIRTSGKIYREDELWSAKVKNYYNTGMKDYEGKYDTDKDSLPAGYDGSVVEFEFTLTGNGMKDSLTVLNSPGNRYSQIVRAVLQREKQYSGPYCCNIPCNVRFHRYASFRHRRNRDGSHSNFVFFTKENPSTSPNLFPPDDDNIYEQSQIDRPAEFMAPGEKGIEHFLTLRWPDRKQEIPPGGIILVRILIEKDGSVRDPEIARGIDERLDLKALNTTAVMGFWKPAYKNGHPVRSRQIVSIR